MLNKMPLLFDELRSVISGNFYDNEINLNELIELCELYVMTVDKRIFHMKKIKNINITELATICLIQKDLICCFSTKKEYQGKGYGNSLLYFVTTKCTSLYLHVRKSNIKAIKLYRRCGFEESGTHINFYNYTSHNEDSIEMRKQ